MGIVLAVWGRGLGRRGEHVITFLCMKRGTTRVCGGGTSSSRVGRRLLHVGEKREIVVDLVIFRPRLFACRHLPALALFAVNCMGKKKKKKRKRGLVDVCSN